LETCAESAQLTQAFTMQYARKALKLSSGG
jgi:hypothetical protein